VLFDLGTGCVGGKNYSGRAKEVHLSGFLGLEFDFERVAQGSKALGDWSGHNSDIEFLFVSGKVCLVSPVL
jgi:hypothetical protein